MMTVENLRERLLRHSLWLGFAAVLIPLGVLLALQYRSLVRVEKTSTVARTATLTKYLSAVVTRVDYFYRAEAQRALNPPAALFQWGRIHQVPFHLAKKEVEGARQLFVLDLTPDEGSRVWFYDPSGPALIPPSDDEASRAVYVAVAPWKRLARQGARIEEGSLSVDERDSNHRIILNPITDHDSRLVAVAGYIVDQRHFEEVVLPRAIADVFGQDAESDADHMPMVRVHDGDGRVVVANAATTRGEDEAAMALGFVFRDWRLGLQARHLEAAQLARSNFLLNMALSMLLATVLIVAVLITLRTAARAVRLSRMKSDFVSNVSHELRTPLASIRVFAEFLRLGRAKDAAKVVEYGDFIETESRRLTQLIDNILDFSKIESGRKTYDLVPGDVELVVRDIVKTFDVRLRHDAARLTVVSPEHPLPRVRMDAGAIGQAVYNLLDNAIKYSDTASEVTVELTSRNGWIRVSVSDRGIGLSRADQDKAFDRFHRVGSSLVHDVKGAGLGLAIVKHIVNAHGGVVEVESIAGQGSTFTIELPEAPGTDGAPSLSRDDVMADDEPVTAG